VTDNSEVLINKPSKHPPGHRAVSRLETILDVDTGSMDMEREFRSAKRTGQIILFVVFGIFGLWSVLAPIDGSSHAAGIVTVKSFKKPVQHLEGGIIKEVKVHDGDRVKAGDVIVVLDDTQAKSQLGSLTAQLKARLAQEARLIAERDNKNSVTYPPELSRDDPLARTEIDAQDHVFKTRISALTGEIQVYQQRVDELQSRIGGQEDLRNSKSDLLKMLQDEIKDYQALLKEGFADKTHLRDLERSQAMTSGEAADLTSAIAASKIQIGEAKLQVLQLQNKNQTEVAAQLSDVQTQIKDLRERITALADAVERSQVRSPDNGVINNLKVHTPGTVIPAGVILAEVVPQSDELIVEAKVTPLDIDIVKVGQMAKIHMSALNSRKVPNLEGKVISLSADAITEQGANGASASYYLARIELTPESLQNLNGEVLVPGMPAEVFITTGSRTLLKYIMRPLTDSMARSLRED